jgi:menaquinone-dependent protoporphyrinogen oxidase
MTRTLVAYASKLGSTGEIAEALAVELRAAGHEVDVQPVTAVRDIEGYGAVIIGSALYAAHWQRDANRFIQRHLAGLQALPVWLFSSGPLDSRLAIANLPITEHAKEVTSSIEARGHRTFGGRLLADAPVDPQVLATHPVGDFRNWDDIQAWGREIAAALVDVPDAPRADGRRAEVTGVGVPVVLTRITTTADGSTRFEQAVEEMELGEFAPPAPPLWLSQSVATVSARFIGAGAGWDSPPHPAPHRQYVVMLRGVVQATTTDGETRTFVPGDVVLLDDIDGPGHQTVVPTGDDWLALVVVLA